MSMSDTDSSNNNSDDEYDRICSKCNQKCNISYDAFECCYCGIIICYNCGDWNRHERKCQIPKCYYCMNGSCFNNGYEDEYYCDECFEPYTEQCNICQKDIETEHVYDEEIFKCDGCKLFFCHECQKPNQYRNVCPYENCYYCNRGFCRNNCLDDKKYCIDCFNDESDSSESVSDNSEKITEEELISMIKEKKFDDIENSFGVKILKKKNLVDKFDNKICSICFNSSTNCKLSCGHLFCLICFLMCKNKSSCPICKQNILNIIRFDKKV